MESTAYVTMANPSTSTTTPATGSIFLLLLLGLMVMFQGWPLLVYRSSLLLLFLHCTWVHHTIRSITLIHIPLFTLSTTNIALPRRRRWLSRRRCRLLLLHRGGLLLRLIDNAQIPEHEITDQHLLVQRPARICKLDMTEPVDRTLDADRVPRPRVDLNARDAWRRRG